MGGEVGTGGESADGGGAGEVADLPRVVEHHGPLKEGSIWSRAWGGDANCEIHALAVSGAGAVYATGLFYGEVDFAPGVDEQLRGSERNTSAFLLGLSVSGALDWVQTWSASDASSGVGWGNAGLSLALTPTGLLVGGQASGNLRWHPPADFEPLMTSEGFQPLLLAFSPSGKLEWARTWPMRRGRIASISHAGDGVVVSGQFDTPFTFGATELSPAGEADCFLGLLSHDGEEQWGTAWGGPFTEYFCTSTAADRIAATGTFDWPVDFGSGPELGEKTGIAGDAFLLETELDGTRRFVRQWGGYGLDNGVSVAALPDGYVVAGEYYGDIDFGTESLPVALGAPNAFVTRVDSSGDVLWTRFFEPSVATTGARVRVAKIATNGDRILITGGFAGEVDFGTGPLQSDEEESSSALDGFVVALDLEGEVQWSRSLRAAGNDVIYGVDLTATDGQAQVVVGGHFAGVADLGFGGEPDVWSSLGLAACFVAKLPAALD